MKKLNWYEYQINQKEIRIYKTAQNLNTVVSRIN